jgi:hypothetical protein
MTDAFSARFAAGAGDPSSFPANIATRPPLELCVLSILREKLGVFNAMFMVNPNQIFLMVLGHGWTLCF